jgi:hypothetical protein
MLLQRGMIRVLGDVTDSNWQAAEEEGEGELEELEKKLKGLDLPPKVGGKVRAGMCCWISKVMLSLNVG